MTNNHLKRKSKGSAILYALIIAAIAAMYVFGSSILNLLNIRSATQQTNGIQAYYAAESAMELAYLSRKLLCTKSSNCLDITYPTSLAGPASQVVISTEINASRDPMLNQIIFDTIPRNNTTNLVRRNNQTITMDARLYQTPGASANSRNEFTIDTTGFFGSAQYKIESVVARTAIPIFIPQIISEITP